MTRNGPGLHQDVTKTPHSPGTRTYKDQEFTRMLQGCYKECRDVTRMLQGCVAQCKVLQPGRQLAELVMGLDELDNNVSDSIMEKDNNEDSPLNTKKIAAEVVSICAIIPRYPCFVVSAVQPSAVVEIFPRAFYYLSMNPGEVSTLHLQGSIHPFAQLPKASSNVLYGVHWSFIGYSAILNPDLHPGCVKMPPLRPVESLQSELNSLHRSTRPRRPPLNDKELTDPSSIRRNVLNRGDANQPGSASNAPSAQDSPILTAGLFVDDPTDEEQNVETSASGSCNQYHNSGAIATDLLC
ncbi:hypothetical protein JOM56_013405 [Amanita muscaria]